MFASVKKPYILRILASVAGLMAVAYSARAQYVAEPVEDKFPFKHQVGITLTPMASRLIGGLQAEHKYGLVWRKRADLSRNLRLGTFFVNRNPTTDRPQRLHALADSGAVMVVDRLRDYGFELRGGMEWFKPAQRHGGVFGMEAVAGLRQMHRSRIYSFMPLDTLSSNDVGLEIEDYRPDDQSKLNIAIMGVSSNFGYAVHAGEHFIFHFMWSPQVIYMLPLSEQFSDVTYSQERFNRGLVFEFSHLEFYLSRKF